MYQIQKETFGAYTKYHCINTGRQNGFSVVPEAGGVIVDVWLQGKQIIEGCTDPEELGRNTSFRSSLLIPFPNRLNHGEYRHNGTRYQFERHQSDPNNALHGFSDRIEMEVLRSDAKSDNASLLLSYFYEGEDDGYPFPFLLEVRYAISDELGFEVHMKLTNEANQDIPVGLGWHPYFRVGNNLDSAELTLPECQMIEVDKYMIPTGNLLEYDYFKNRRTIRQAVLDNGFKLKNENGKAEFRLSENGTALCYWQETGPGKFNFFQVFTPDHRKSIAIEPMTCNIDAFNNGNGLIILSPEKSMEASCGFRLENT